MGVICLLLMTTIILWSDAGIQPSAATADQSNCNKCNQQKPAFSASISSDTAFAKGKTFIFKNVHVNIGKMYNPTTGVATIPSDGNYMITWRVLTNAGKSTYPYLKVNNVYQSSTACDARGSRGVRISCGNTVILPLKRGNKVWIEEWTGNSGHPNVQGGFSSFTVMKL